MTSIEHRASTHQTSSASHDYDVVIVGAGFAGVYLIHRLRGLGFTVKAFEAGSDAGGTWYWNRYPGARCDAESIDYCYSFSEELLQDWTWTERFATQPEILAYIQHVVDRFDLRRDIQFDTRVLATVFDDDSNTWEVRTENDASITSRFVIMATGCLSSSRLPDLDALESFRGNWYHTGRWPHDGVDFTGRRVAVIGTGSSGIQAIPRIAEQAEHVHVFQRTPNFSVPAQNAPLSAEYVARIKDGFAARREESRRSLGGQPMPTHQPSALDETAQQRIERYRSMWEHGGPLFLAAYSDLMVNRAANDTAVAFIHERILEIVKDPQIAQLLLPKSYPVGAKRICVDTDYYATFNRSNVTLVDCCAQPVLGATENGLRTPDGEFGFDDIVFATGYDAMTGALLNIDIRGAGGQTLRDKWHAGPKTYLGLATAGFPNLFIVTGPGSPSVLSNMLVSIEQHVEWITDLLDVMRKRGLTQADVAPEAEDQWVAHVNEVASHTLFMQANSWYLGANVPGKPRVFMPYVGGVGTYRLRCEHVAAQGYEGFLLSSPNTQVSAATGTA